MAKQCTNCGNYLLDDEKFCTRCGTNAYSANDNAQQAQPQAEQPQTAQQSAPQGVATVPQPVYQPPTADDGSAKMSVGAWVGTVILTTWFGLISIILLFVWGFGANTPKAKANYCKAMLIVWCIIIALSIIATIVFVVAISIIISQYPDIFEQIEDALETLVLCFE